MRERDVFPEALQSVLLQKRKGLQFVAGSVSLLQRDKRRGNSISSKRDSTASVTLANCKFPKTAFHHTRFSTQCSFCQCGFAVLSTLFTVFRAKRRPALALNFNQLQPPQFVHPEEKAAAAAKAAAEKMAADMKATQEQMEAAAKATAEKLAAHTGAVQKAAADHATALQKATEDSASAVQEAAENHLSAISKAAKKHTAALTGAAQDVADASTDAVSQAGSLNQNSLDGVREPIR